MKSSMLDSMQHSPDILAVDRTNLQINDENNQNLIKTGVLKMGNPKLRNLGQHMNTSMDHS